MRLALAVLLLPSALLALGAVESATPAIAPDAAGIEDAEEGVDDDTEVIRGGLLEQRGFAWEVGIAGAIGSEERVAGGLVRTRAGGELLDGTVWANATHLGRPAAHRMSETLRSRTITLTAGTDAQAGDEGEALVALAMAQRGWRGEIPMYSLEGSAGWSDERDWLASADLTLGLAHVGIERDDSGRAFRFGARIATSPHRSMVAELGIDRIVSYQLDDDRFYATETFVAFAMPLGDNLMARLSGAYAHGSRTTDGTLEHGTEGAIAIICKTGGGF